ncbi:MAG: phospho-sugar mutase [Bacteroidales bacterium]|nr:phospho-sugar mutase [Bacteroidales bacterium]
MEKILEKAKYWTTDLFDEPTRKAVAEMIAKNDGQLTECFYKDLEFGTGGLRGIMDVGTNRMNRYTVGMATQGLANYLLKNCSPKDGISCAIAHDSRNNSREFAKITASVLSANGIKVYLFDKLRPTPELSFAIRHLHCNSGIVITASHNPKEYNGYKVYWSDGGQVIPPHDTGIIEEVRKVEVKDIKFDDALANVVEIGENIDKVYIETLAGLCHNVDKNSSTPLKIVYTPIHGSSISVLPQALKRIGFSDINIVEEQATPDGNFPTVKSPNPEERETLSIAIQNAERLDADIVIGTDPDSDRLGVVVKHNGKFMILNGNQTASILVYYLLESFKNEGKLKGKEFIVKTIVTTELIAKISKDYGVQYYDVLTGFKYIAEIIEKNYGKLQFIGGGEESYGFLAGDAVRDKDAVIASMLICEIAAKMKAEGKTLMDLLCSIYQKYGFYYEGLKSLTKPGQSGMQEIEAMMEKFRNTPPESICGEQVVMVHDFLVRKSYDKISELSYDITLPKSNVLQYDLADGSKITVRPSGTEPKIKFYIGVIGNLDSQANYDKVAADLQSRVNEIIDYITKY